MNTVKWHVIAHRWVDGVQLVFRGRQNPCAVGRSCRSTGGGVRRMLLEGGGLVDVVTLVTIGRWRVLAAD